MILKCIPFTGLLFPILASKTKIFSLHALRNKYGCEILKYVAVVQAIASAKILGISYLTHNLRWINIIDVHMTFIYIQFSLSYVINLFTSNALFLYPLKTSENLTVFYVFRG